MAHDIANDLSVKEKQTVHQPQQQNAPSNAALNLGLRKVQQQHQTPTNDIGISDEKGVQRQESSVQALQQPCGLSVKRKLNSSTGMTSSPPIIQPADQDAKEKEVMAVVDAFNIQSVDNGDVVLIEEELDKDLLLDDDQFEANLGKVVGGGSYGCIFDWKKSTTNSGNAIKVKQIQYNPEVKAKKQTNPNEVIIPLKLKRHDIVRTLGIRHRGDKLWILMEDAGPSLKWWMSNRESDEFRRWIRIKQQQNLTDFGYKLFKIGCWLERHSIVHRDIKMENICVCLKEGGQFVPTLVDFGSIQTEQDKPVINGHTPEYLPPRLVDLIYMLRTDPQSVTLESQFFEEKCDAWGFAMVILTLHLGGFHPIDDVNQYVCNPDLRSVVVKKIIHMQEGMFQGLIDTMVGPLKVVVENILRVDPHHRWTSKGACDHLEQSDGGDTTKPVMKKARIDDELKKHGCTQKPSSSQSNSTATDLSCSYKKQLQLEQNWNQHDLAAVRVFSKSKAGCVYGLTGIQLQSPSPSAKSQATKVDEGRGGGGGVMSAQQMEQEDFVVAGGAAATAGCGRMVMTCGSAVNGASLTSGGAAADVSGIVDRMAVPNNEMLFSAEFDGGGMGTGAALRTKKSKGSNNRMVMTCGSAVNGASLAGGGGGIVDGMVVPNFEMLFSAEVDGGGMGTGAALRTKKGKGSNNRRP